VLRVNNNSRYSLHSLPEETQEAYRRKRQRIQQADKVIKLKCVE
jgi:hypothetical protein